MGLVKKFLYALLIFIVLTIVVYNVYMIYLRSNYYVASGAIDGEEVAKIAASKNDPNICGKIRTGPFFLEGFDITTEEIILHCYLKTAHLLNDEKICDYIPELSYSEYKAICIENIAIEKKDFNLCDNINDLLERGNCYSFFTETGTDAIICERINDSNDFKALSGRDICYLNSVEYSKDIKVCDEKIISPDYKDFCYTLIARQRKDPAICEKIISTDYEYFYKRECITGAQ